jgi:hypothetical protein
MRRIAGATLILLLGCQGGMFDRREPLSFVQYNSLAKGMTYASVRDAFGRPAHVLERQGGVRGLSYPCEDATGAVLTLRMTFDDRGRLDRWGLQKSP